MGKRYIDTENINLKGKFSCGLNDNGILYVPFREIQKVIDDIPTANVEEIKYGKWINDSDDVYWGNYIVKKHCSECGYTPVFDRETGLFNLTKRCPECGAHMRKDKET